MSRSLAFGLLLSLKQVVNNENNKTKPQQQKFKNKYSCSKKNWIILEDIIGMGKIPSLCRQVGLEYTWPLVSRVQGLQAWSGSWQSMDRVALSWECSLDFCKISQVWTDLTQGSCLALLNSRVKKTSHTSSHNATSTSCLLGKKLFN